MHISGVYLNPKFLNTAASEWLVREGYATAQPRTDNRLMDYQPTRKEENAGLSAGKYTNRDGGACFYPLLDGRGQRLLRDNVEQIRPWSGGGRRPCLLV